MTRRTLIVLALLVVPLAWLLLPTGEALSQQIEQVLVANWPTLWKVEGKVEIDEPIKLARVQTIRDIIVAPVKRSDTTRLVDAGIVTTDGYPSIVLSLHGVVKGTVQRPGSVGVILLPEEETIRQAFFEQDQLHFSLETAAHGVTSQTPYFASQQPRYTVGFTRYRALLYNTTDKTVTANIFAYLTQ